MKNPIPALSKILFPRESRNWRALASFVVCWLIIIPSALSTIVILVDGLSVRSQPFAIQGAIMTLVAVIILAGLQRRRPPAEIHIIWTESKLGLEEEGTCITYRFEFDNIDRKDIEPAIQRLRTELVRELQHPHRSDR